MSIVPLTSKEITLSEAIRAFADHVEIPYAPDVPQLIRSLLTIFDKSRLTNDRQVVLDMFAMIFKHYLKYNLYMINHYDQEGTNGFFDKLNKRSKLTGLPLHPKVFKSSSKDGEDSFENLDAFGTDLSSKGAKKTNRSHLFRMVPNQHCFPTNISLDSLYADRENCKFLLTNEDDSEAETESEDEVEDEKKGTPNKKSPNNNSTSKTKETKGKGKGDKRLSEDLNTKTAKRSFETAFRDKFTLGEDSTKTTALLLEAFNQIKDFLVSFSSPKDEDEEENCQLIADWSIETLSEMYEEASGSYGSLEDSVYVSFDTWQEMFKVIRSCPYFDVIEGIFEKFLFSPLDSTDIGATIVKQSTPPRSWIIAYMNYCLWSTIDSKDFDMSLTNHFAILDQVSDDEANEDRGFSKIRMFLHILKYISDEEPELIIGSCMSNVPIFLNLCGTSRELLNCYMSQLDVLNDNMLPSIFEYPDSEEIIGRMFDILRFSQNGFQLEMLQDHIEALLDSLISIIEDSNRCFTGELNERQSFVDRFIKNISAQFVASLISFQDTDKNSRLKMSFVKALATGNCNNLRLTFKAELLSLFLQSKIKDSKPDIAALRCESFEELFDELTDCFNSDSIVQLVSLIFPDLVKFPTIAGQQMAMAFFVSLLISKDFCKKGLYNGIVGNFGILRKDPICIYHNLRLLDHWSELYFRSILPDHKDYIFLFPMLMETYFKTVKKLSLLEVTDKDYGKLKILYPKILRQILNYFGRFTGLRHCNIQIASCFVTTCFRNSSKIPASPQGYIEIDFLMELLKQIAVEHDQEQLRNFSDLFVKALQTHFVSKKIGLYIIPQVENELKLLEFFRENEFFMYIFEFFSKRQALRWFHHILKGLLSASISELQSSRAMTPDFVNCGVALFEMFSNGEYYSKSFLRLIDHMQDFNTFTRAEQVTILEEVLRVFARYGAEICMHWKTDFFRNHFAQSRLLISDKLPNPEEVLAEIEVWKPQT